MPIACSKIEQILTRLQRSPLEGMLGVRPSDTRLLRCNFIASKVCPSEHNSNMPVWSWRAYARMVLSNCGEILDGHGCTWLLTRATGSSACIVLLKANLTPLLHAHGNLLLTAPNTRVPPAPAVMSHHDDRRMRSINSLMGASSFSSTKSNS